MRAMVVRLLLVALVSLGAVATAPALEAGAEAPVSSAHEAGHAVGHDGHHADCTCDDLATLFCCGADCADSCTSDCAAGSGSGAALVAGVTTATDGTPSTLRASDQTTPRQPGLAPEGPPPQHA